MEEKNAASLSFRLFVPTSYFQRMTSLGGDIMLQRGRLPLQQLFNNNNRKQHLAPTNNFHPGSTNNNQFPASSNNRMSSIQNYRSQILKNSQQTFSSRRGLGEQSFISTGNKCHHCINVIGLHHYIILYCIIIMYMLAYV